MAASPRETYTRVDAAVVAFCAVAAVALIATHWEYTLDDTYIYVQYAHNILAGHGMAFNAGDPVYGFTSPLWLWMIVACGACGVGLLAAAKLLGLIATILSIAIVHVAARRWIASAAIASIVTVCWTTNAWLVRWGACGIETPLAVAACIGALYVYAVERDRGRVRWSPVVVGVAFLVRPEAGLLAAMECVDYVMHARGARWRMGLRFAGIAAATVAPWLVVAASTFHTIVPTTFAAKTGGVPSIADFLETAGRTVRVIGATSVIEVLACAALFVASIRARRSTLPGLVPAWGIALPLALIAANADVQSRYTLIAVPALMIAGWSAVECLLADRRRARMIAVMTGAMVIAINQTVIWTVVAPHTRAFTRTVDDALAPIGRWVRAHTPRDAVVAGPDIGALGYFSHRTILDLGGLVTPTLQARTGNAPYDSIVINGLYARLGRPTMLIDRGDSAGRLLRPGAWPHLDSLASWYAPSLGIGSHTLGVEYTAYRVTY